ncbi:EcsC family protein [Micromonospora sp. WMMD882]|uniref:EcsC family protein n=1 Tax=Micromonospora sp. WMMD882 TaxID=3015151 RepID=UPI00248C8F85|nr:EcsC family protein [Micromonospora sp. WMMD882]WBB81541.1 EcsC family protein [Micromonospora sp. WMMD882]
MTDSTPVDGQTPAPAPRPPAPAPAPGPVDPPPVAGPADPPDVPEAPPARLWDRMREDPQYAPEHLALEAVRRLGPEATRWVARVRAEQPGITADALADLAVRRFVNRARLSGAVSGAAGLPGAVIDVGVLAWTQARMVLHVAAAYGVDPQHADRATDLLVLQKVHKVAETARVALGMAAGRERAGALFGGGSQPALGRVMVRLGVRLAQMAGVRAAKRVFAKVVPGAAIVLGTWANSSATKDLARRSRELYRERGAGAVPPPRRP